VYLFCHVIRVKPEHARVVFDRRQDTHNVKTLALFPGERRAFVVAELYDLIETCSHFGEYRAVADCVLDVEWYLVHGVSPFAPNTTQSRRRQAAIVRIMARPPE